MLRRQKSEFISAAGTVFEFVKALSDEVRELGGSDGDLRKVIAQATLRRQIAQVIMGRDSKKFPSLAIAGGLVPQGWEIVEDIAPSAFQVSDLKLVSFLEKGENYVGGEMMHQRAVTLKANLGLADAKYLLDNQGEIPIEFRNKALVFTGTLLRGSGGDLHVADLYWGGDHACLNFYWLAYGWFDFNRLLRCK